MPESFVNDVDLEALAHRVGTPFFVVSGDVLRRRIGDIRRITDHPQLQARYAMKAYSLRRVLEEMLRHEIWIDAVSGNEALRAQAAGFPMGAQPPVVLLTADVFRDNALSVVMQQGLLPNIGSPAMIEDLQRAGYRGPIAVRLNPGFGHGHVRACDTGGPSSKHGIWYADAEAVRTAAARAGYPIVMLHTHIGSGPAIDEFTANMGRLTHFYVECLLDYPDAEAVSMGGGIPHPYRPEAPSIDLTPVGAALRDAQRVLSDRAGRPIRVEIEPGRYIVAPSCALIARVTDVKETRTNEKGPGHTFAMIDAGFVDLIRPAMYGLYHHITLHGAAASRPTAPVVIAGPLCESGDVFTRDDGGILEPRELPQPKRGDLVVLHDAGAYGAAMSSHYNSIGRAPHVWLDGGETRLIARRETVEDITRAECSERL